MASPKGKTGTQKSSLGFERRRSRRRRLHKPCEVQLHGVGDELGWQATGALLNVSTDGVACRLANQKAYDLCVRQTVRVVFRIGSSPTRFDLKAQITNLTAAGTPEHQVLGLEFVDDANLEAAQPALREAIANANAPSGQQDGIQS